MSYTEIVTELRKHYPVLWFWPGTQNFVHDTGEPANWSYASILSPGGRYLAYPWRFTGIRGRMFV